MSTGLRGHLRRLARRIAPISVTVVLMACGSATAQPLLLGFSDSAFEGNDATAWLQRSRTAGADMVRINIGWDAPDTTRRPAGFDARNPADPRYAFAPADAAIRQAAAQHLGILAEFTGAPAWAEGPNPAPGTVPGSWRPSPAAIADYAVALGRRYSGHFPDPLHPGQSLPRVAAFQLWNEPNLVDYLAPQYTGAHAVAPGLYRSMLNAFYRGLKSVDPGALVVSAGTAPFGDAPGGRRTPPVPFWQGVLCLAGQPRAPVRIACPDPAHFDILAHHPYSVGPPTEAALNPGDVSIPDLGKLTRLLRAAERLGTALPARRHAVWVTETSYDSSPPDPRGIPIETQARWLEQTFGELWHEGVSAVFWNQVGDQPPIPSYAATVQSGVYYRGGAPKPALTAYRFPLVTWPAGAGTSELWGRSPVAGRVELEERIHGRWRVLRRLTAGAHQVFVVRVPARHLGAVRALAGAQTSLVWPGR